MGEVETTQSHMKAERHPNKVVIVTGASSGIGRGIARRFAEEGANVVVADIRRDPKQGERFGIDETIATDEVIREELGGDAIYVKTDVSDPDDVHEMVEKAVDTFGGVDVLVNNAGIHIPGDSQEIDVEDWESVISVDLDGVFYCAKFAIPHLKASEGRIINIGSVNSQEGGGGPPYASAKGAIVNLTRDLAVELGDDSVTVNAICPGFIQTPIQDYLSDEEMQVQLDQTLLPYTGVPEDIGNAAVFLASDEARFITGEALYVDGGWTAHSL